MRRRAFITLLGGAAAWPLTARSQQRAMPVIGVLSSQSPEVFTSFIAPFRQGLKEAGYVEHQNLTIHYRWAETRFDRLPTLAADLVRDRVTVIFAAGAPSALAAKAATGTIPIVFVTAVDPVALGLVASLNLPGDNLTGVTQLGVEIGPKRLELLHKVIPAATTVALLVDPTEPTSVRSGDLQTAARTLGLQMPLLEASSEADFDRVFARLPQLGADALLIAGANFFNGRLEQLAELALRNRVPASYPSREFTAAGGLTSYGTDRAETYRQAGVYAGRVLSGEKPADLPVMQPTKLEFVINQKTAKALGLIVPPSLLAVADEVIE
jgi:putative ABC transport system substrate-binding protein